MTSNSHTYFSNHSQTRLLANSNSNNATSGNPGSNSNNGGGGNGNGHISGASNGSGGGNGGGGNHNHIGATTGPTFSSIAASSAPSAPLARSKHFSTTVGGDKERGGNALSGAGGLGGARGDGAKTVHPLRSTWVFWFRQQRSPGNKVTNYEEGIKKITAFSSVESFWSIWTHLNPPSTLLPTTDYLLFHSQIRRPVWEDPLNIEGGKWIIRLRKGIADRLWEDLVLGIIGDQFEEEDEICGCVLSVRSQEDILSVWNRNEKDSVARGRISDTIRKLLNLPPSTTMEYKSNNDSMQDKSSFRTTSVDRSGGAYGA